MISISSFLQRISGGCDRVPGPILSFTSKRTTLDILSKVHLLRMCIALFWIVVAIFLLSLGSPIHVRKPQGARRFPRRSKVIPGFFLFAEPSVFPLQNRTRWSLKAPTFFYVVAVAYDLFVSPPLCQEVPKGRRFRAA